MKTYLFTIFLTQSLLASAKSNINDLEAINRHEIYSLTMAKSLSQLNTSKKNTIDLKRFYSLCQLERSEKNLPLNCYRLKERLVSLKLIPKSDYDYAVKLYDEECLNLVPKVANEENLPSLFPDSMGQTCIETIKLQKNKLRYIFSEK